MCTIIRETERTALNLPWMTIPQEGLWSPLLKAFASPSTNAVGRILDKPNNVLTKQVA